ncbi:glycosyltransferase family 2 protein [Candidatus Pseudothioglobus sp. Uisw_041]|jgi:cellulose synthase/poly-beta-1,6-N-acetylglucosamine synthase-like glycosyltransferase|uniref:glycosyltransferase family A protein n=1 Tax=Candidatus Pseudothioglobus sp. Uisw_041 TaxID=3230996 RepID=UPI003A8C7DED
MTDFLQIIILSRDRVDLIQNSIDSAIAQNEPGLDYEIIISDNSDNDDVNELINKYYLKSNKIKYIRREPPLSGNAHYEVVISELNAKYAVIFHDDDILHPDYIKQITPLILNDSIAAVGCNALTFNNKIGDATKKTHNFKSIKKFDNKKDFLQQYLVGNGGIAPFPGYIYKTKFIQKIPFKSLISGKHLDVSLLASLLDYGAIAWIPEALMYYRVHLKGDSATEVIPHRLKYLRYAYSEGIDRESKSVFLSRYLWWFNWIRQQGSFTSNISKWKYRIVTKFLIFRFFNVISTSYFWFKILKKMSN